jgi:hypothetical protein
MVFEDDEIGRSIREDQTGSTKAQREAARTNRSRKLFAAKMQEAKKSKDRFGFERLLELQGLKRGSAAWNAAWEYFYSDET